MLVLLGIAVIVIGFVLRLNPLLVIAASALVTGWASGHDPLEILGANGTNPEVRTQTARKLPPTERRALEILEAKETWTRGEIRKQYKSLVKDLHPDMNGGDRSDEDRLQAVVWAWDQIKDSRSFKD